MKTYRGISYFRFLDKIWIRKLWKKFFCKREIHLFDEVLGEDHLLFCDACGLHIYIEKIQTEKEVIAEFDKVLKTS